ncbi:MAG: hypothetical protein F6J90_18200 [Moorea sp. SIOASIH]|uniref:hypothetical protein n=1 Tax=Moorena sp. SIOASIH TaxID=2607817 RepID=UPI0013BCDEBC|nr:hypothetical protein [Moorena sp. SIOASIH]NEO38156.1 hypothetical protein [Moorena sp. SIOASIH]
MTNINCKHMRYAHATGTGVSGQPSVDLTEIKRMLTCFIKKLIRDTLIADSLLSIDFLPATNNDS